MGSLLCCIWVHGILVFYTYSGFPTRTGASMKVLILIMLAAIVGSLMSGLFFLTRQDEKSSARMLASLKIRVGLSILLVAFLVSAFFLGLIPTE